MKKYFIIAAAAFMAIAACTKVEPTVKDTDRPIQFSVISRVPQTKASTTGLVYPTSSAFGTFAWWTDATWATAASPMDFVFMDNERIYYHNNTGTPSFWAPQSTYYWTKTGYLTFASYSPYVSADANDAPNVAATDQAATGFSVVPTYDYTKGFLFNNYTVVAGTDVDLMYADLAADCTQDSNGEGNLVYDGTTTGENPTDHGYKGVPTIFHHALCQLGFEFRALGNLNPNVDKIKIELTAVNIYNIDKTGSFTQIPATANTARWATVHSTAAVASYDFSPASTITMEVKEDNAENRTNVAYTHTNVIRILLPQALQTDDNPNDATVDPIATTTDQKLVITYNIKSHYKNTADDVWAVENDVKSTIRLVNGNILAWKDNQNITYRITINPYASEKITFDPAVVDWESKNSDDIVVTPDQPAA